MDTKGSEAAPHLSTEGWVLYITKNVYNSLDTTGNIKGNAFIIDIHEVRGSTKGGRLHCYEQINRTKRFE